MLKFEVKNIIEENNIVIKPTKIQMANLNREQTDFMHIFTKGVESKQYNNNRLANCVVYFDNNQICIGKQKNSSLLFIIGEKRIKNGILLKTTNNYYPMFLFNLIKRIFILIVFIVFIISPKPSIDILVKKFVEQIHTRII